MWSSVAMAAILAACTADEMLSERRTDQLAYMAEELTPVRVGVALGEEEWADDADTRAGQTLNDGEFSLMYSTNSNSAVCLYADDGSGSNYTFYEYKVVAGSGENAISPASTAAYFPTEGTTVNVYGWYPYNSGSTSFTVKDNQTADNDYILSDLMLANKDRCTRAKNNNNVYVVTAAPLAFRHVMAKVKLNVTAGTGVTIKSVKISGVKRTVVISGPDGNGELSIGPATGNADDITVHGTIAAGATANVAAVIPPQTLTGSFVEINATYGNKTGNVTYQLGSNGKAFATNTVYKATMTVNKQDIGQTISIAQWTEAIGSVTVKPTTTGGNISFEGDTDLTLTYGDSNGTAIINEMGGTFTATSSDTGIATAAVSSTTVTITPEGAGSAKVYVTKSDGTSYGVLNVTVNKATPTVTDPSYVSSTLTYNGSGQTLITSGSSPTGTTLYYAVNQSASSAPTTGWGTTLPTGTDVGTYYVWYKVEGGANYNDFDAVVLTGGKEIGKGTPTLKLSQTSVSQFVGSTTSVTITRDTNTTHQSISVSSNDDSVATGSITDNTLNITLGNTAGTATLTVKVEGNEYWNEKTAVFTATVIPQDTSLSNLKSSWDSQYLGASVYNDGTVSWYTSLNGMTRIGVVAYHAANTDVDSGVNGSRILVLATDNARESCQWGHSNYTCDNQSHGTYTYSKSGNSGYLQTQALCENGSNYTDHPAAYAAWTYNVSLSSIEGRSDLHWFLPSSEQWGWMKDQRDKAGMSSSGYYWSSTEYNSSYAYSLNGYYGNVSKYNSKLNNLVSRACFAY
mgnify:CR=1 FL=1